MRPALSLASLTVAAACATTPAATEDGAAPGTGTDVEPTDDAHPDENEADGLASSFAYAARGHAYVGRLLCPSGVPPKKGMIMTGRDDQDRLEDTYALTCPASEASVRFPRDTEPKVPEGWSLLTAEDIEAFKEASAPGEHKDWAAAEAVLDPLLERQPTWVAARRLRAVARFRTLQPEAAWDDLARIKDVDERLRFEWIMVGSRIGRCDAVRSDADRLAQTKEAEWELYPMLTCIRAQCAGEAGDRATASALAERACDLGVSACCAEEP